MTKSLILALALLVSLAMAVTGTIAYLQDTDEDVNVMTLGNVKIEQLEFERIVDAGEWVPTGETDKYGYIPDEIREFTQDKPLYPIYAAEGVIWDDRVPGHQQSWGNVASDNDVVVGAPGSNQLFDDSVVGAVDKFVFVANTGTSDAYVRTWFAFEQGSLSDEDFDRLIGTNADADHWEWETVATGVEIDGNTYVVAVATYLGPTSNPTGVLAPGAITYPSLLQVYMAPEATNDDVTAVDGDGSGTYDILVLSQAVQTTNFPDAETALNAAFGGIDEAVAVFADMEVPPSTHECWDGSVDTSWYNDTDTEFVITTAEQLAGLAELVSGGNNFAGKTVKLAADLRLCCTECSTDEERPSFPTIGNSSNSFDGTFDGQNHVIEDLYQSGWAFGYEWGSYGSIGLFGSLNNATVENLTISGAECLVEGGDVGGLTGSATGTCVFENITIEASVFATYNNGNGGIIGWSGDGDYTFKNVTIAEDVVLAGLWGSFDSSIGGVVGQGEPGATYTFEDVDVACRIDAYNDCTASYDYYNYRMCGMLIGRLEETTTIDGSNYPDTSKYNITCTNVTVTYGDWANYHYCDPTPGLNNGRGMRVEAGYSYDGLPADYDHSQCTTHCKQLMPFDQVFGGAQLGVKGLPTYTGVNVVYNNK